MAMLYCRAFPDGAKASRGKNPGDVPAQRGRR